jgi:hypothetical protein
VAGAERTDHLALLGGKGATHLEAAEIDREGQAITWSRPRWQTDQVRKGVPKQQSAPPNPGMTVRGDPS